jgi:hypothetical protein
VTLGFDLTPYGADGDFGGVTERAVRAFQTAAELDVDGVVGKDTWQALLQVNADTLPAPAVHRGPPPPDFPPLVTNAERHAWFGQFSHRPVPGGDGAAQILGTWIADRTTIVEIPQLKRIPGIIHQGQRVGQGPRTGRVRCHELVADQLRRLWQAGALREVEKADAKIETLDDLIEELETEGARIQVQGRALTDEDLARLQIIQHTIS